jgi:hypothetical protein
MNEKLITDYYKKFTRWLCSYMNNSGVTTAGELNEIGKEMFGDKFTGVYPQDLIPEFHNPCYFIFNIDTHNKEGIHWLGCYFDGTKYFVYDSFGRTSKRIVPIFVRQVKAEQKKYTDADYDPEQKDSQDDCGQRTLSFLKMVERYGVKNALLI